MRNIGRIVLVRGYTDWRIDHTSILLSYWASRCGTGSSSNQSRSASVTVANIPVSCSGRLRTITSSGRRQVGRALDKSLDFLTAVDGTPRRARSDISASVLNGPPFQLRPGSG